MTVGQLIEELSKHPADMPVLVEGYENGYDDAAEVAAGDFARKPRPMWWDGDYDKTGPDAPGRFAGLAIRARQK